MRLSSVRPEATIGGLVRRVASAGCPGAASVPTCARRHPRLRPGRLALARSLTSRDHSVAVIDQDAEAFARLGDDFPGRTVTGIGFDREILVEAGIEQADAFAAVSSGDNSNIIAARVARETFGVERVVARIYDPRRAEVYERLGIPTVATVRWTADQILRRVLPE